MHDSHPARANLALFSDSFEDVPARAVVTAAPPEPSNASFSEADLAEARAAGYDAGQRAARKVAEADLRLRVADALAVIAARLEAARDAAMRIAEDSAAALAHLLLDALGAGFPALRAHYGEAELRRMIAVILPALAREPKVTVRVHPALADAVSAELAALPRDGAAAPAIEADPATAPGDATIAWADGCAVRDSDAAWRAVAEVLQPLGLLPAATETG